MTNDVTQTGEAVESRVGKIEAAKLKNAKLKNAKP